MKPVVSILCQAFMHEKFIRQAIDGFLMQKTNFPIEILIHDDASKDKTADIIREYEEKYPDLIYPIYQTENQFSKGVRITLTFQIPRAQGKYIAICEGDDYWTDPYKLQKQVDFMEANPGFSLTFHNAEFLYENSDRKNKLFNLSLEKSVFTLKDAIEETRWFVPTPSILFRKEMIEIPEWLKHVQQGDKAIQLILLLKGNLNYMDEVMCVYRKHSTSLGAVTNESKTKIKQIQLYTYFNMYTQFKYNDSIEIKINHFKNELSKSLLRENKISLFIFLKNVYLRFMNKTKSLL